jgi:hypothetical protein
MSLDKNTLIGGIFLVGLYSLVAQPLATTMATVGISALLYMLVKSEVIVLGFMLASLFIRDLNKLFLPHEPVGIEAFQVRDAPSVHARLESVKQNIPKVATVTGVLESPDILDNTPLQAMDSLGREGVPGASIPASAKARVMINPIAEAFMGAPNESVDRNPMENPPLQNGPDAEAVNASLIDDGTAMTEPEVPSSDMAGMNTNADA